MPIQIEGNLQLFSLDTGIYFSWFFLTKLNLKVDFIEIENSFRRCEETLNLP